MRHTQLQEGNSSVAAPTAFHRRRRNGWLGDWRPRTGCTRSSRTVAYPRTARTLGTRVWPAQLTSPRTLGRSGSQVGFESHSGDTAPHKGTVSPGLRQVAFGWPPGRAHSAQRIWSSALPTRQQLALLERHLKTNHVREAEPEVAVRTPYASLIGKVSEQQRPVGKRCTH